MISEAGVKIKKFKLQKIFLKDILNNLQSNYKAQATATFLISALISEIWAFKAKKCLYLLNLGSNKKSVLRKKVLKFVFLGIFGGSKKNLIFFLNFDFFGTPFEKIFFFLLYSPEFIYSLGY